MYYYLRRLFASRSINPRQLQRTVSGLDPQHIESGNYIYKNFIKNKSPPPPLDSLKLLNIYGEGTLNRAPFNPHNYSFIDIWGGGLWPKKQHPSNQKQCRSSDHSTNCSQPPASQKNSSSPPTKSSP